jgi:hypothetical protein
VFSRIQLDAAPYATFSAGSEPYVTTVSATLMGDCAVPALQIVAP